MTREFPVSICFGLLPEFRRFPECNHGQVGSIRSYTPRNWALVELRLTRIRSWRQPLCEAKLVPVRISDVKETLTPGCISRRLRL
jgi:hypothetical protein